MASNDQTSDTGAIPVRVITGADILTAAGYATGQGSDGGAIPVRFVNYIDQTLYETQTASVTLTSTNARTTVANSASAITITLPTAPTPHERREVLNIGAGLVSVVYTGLTGTTPALTSNTASLAQYSSANFQWFGTAIGWIQVA